MIQYTDEDANEVNLNKGNTNNWNSNDGNKNESIIKKSYRNECNKIQGNADKYKQMGVIQYT